MAIESLTSNALDNVGRTNYTRQFEGRWHIDRFQPAQYTN